LESYIGVPGSVMPLPQNCPIDNVSTKMADFLLKLNYISLLNDQMNILFALMHFKFWGGIHHMLVHGE
jgi:hypothetical protein